MTRWAGRPTDTGSAIAAPSCWAWPPSSSAPSASPSPPASAPCSPSRSSARSGARPSPRWPRRSPAPASPARRAAGRSAGWRRAAPAPASWASRILTGIDAALGWRAAFVGLALLVAATLLLGRLVIAPDAPVGTRPPRVGAMLRSYAPLFGHRPTLGLIGASALSAMGVLDDVDLPGRLLRPAARLHHAAGGLGVHADRPSASCPGRSPPAAGSAGSRCARCWWAANWRWGC